MCRDRREARIVQGSAHVSEYQKSNGPGYSWVANRAAIWKASWSAPRSASSLATASFCWSCGSARRVWTACAFAPAFPDATARYPFSKAVRSSADIGIWGRAEV